MELGYGVGGGATAIESTRRRWLAVLLAFLLGAAMAFVASPAQSGEYGNGAPDVTIIEPGDGDVFGIPDTVNLEATFTDDDEEWESESETTYTCEIDWDDGTVENSDETDDVTVTNPEEGPGTCEGSHSYDEDDFYTIMVTVTDPGDNTGSDEVTIEIVLQVINCDGNGNGDTCEEFDDPEDGEWEATCDGCGGQVRIRDEDGEVADIEITAPTGSDLTLTTADEGLPPGKSSVVVVTTNGNGEVETELPNCGKKGKKKNTPKCVHINRVNDETGKHTQYIVFFTTDPRFRFR